MTLNDQPTVLVVDDDRLSRTALANLIAEDCRVILAKDGPSALRRVSGEKISLILLDASMPGMSGYEVLHHLKADKKTSGIEVIFVTGRTDEQDEERGLLLGAVDYIFKPIRPSLVRARVRNHLKLVLQREELERLSLQDGLTGLANRRYFDQELERACRHATRTGEPLSLAMIDVDYFKQYNDCYGHSAGDQALCKVAETLAAGARRPYDIAARYGGEEFVLLLPNEEDIKKSLDRILAGVADLKIRHETSGVADYLTVSCGGVSAVNEHTWNPEALIARADEALYQAKSDGRNRVVVLKP